MKNKIRFIIAGTAVAGALLIGSFAFAAGPMGFDRGGGIDRGGPNATSTRERMMPPGSGRGTGPNVFGKVVSVNGTKITMTITAKMGPNINTGSTFTVDATNATVTKNNKSSSVQNIAVGDIVMVKGTISGTNITASAIRDGLPEGDNAGQKEKQNPHQQQALQGNGQPVVGGKVTVINGTAITVVTEKGNITYTVDTSGAVIMKGRATSTISSVAVGDNVIVQGAVNGTSISASSVIDQGARPVPATNGAATNAPEGKKGGFLGAVGGFFQRIFNFF